MFIDPKAEPAAEPAQATQERFAEPAGLEAVAAMRLVAEPAAEPAQATQERFAEPAVAEAQLVAEVELEA